MNNKNGSRGIGICGVLTIVFVVLKLVGVINWSWWLVLMPLWIDLLLGVLLLILAALITRESNRKLYGRTNRWKH